MRGLTLFCSNIIAGEKNVQAVWKDFSDLNSVEFLTWMNAYFDESQPPSERNHAPAPFYRIFVPNSQVEFKESKVHVHAPLNGSRVHEKQWVVEHKRYRSDHLPVWCDLTIGNDDD